MILLKSYEVFQSTLPHGERLDTAVANINRLSISIHAPARGATKNPPIAAVKIVNFNPRSRTGSDVMDKEFLQIFDISIHAPARGATGNRYQTGRGFLFQSTLPHGERLPSRLQCHFSFGFQSTLPHGERLSTYAVAWICVNISIHAPARGATFSSDTTTKNDHNFNPRSRTGSDKHTTL